MEQESSIETVYQRAARIVTAPFYYAYVGTKLGVLSGMLAYMLCAHDRKHPIPIKGPSLKLPLSNVIRGSAASVPVYAFGIAAGAVCGTVAGLAVSVCALAENATQLIRNEPLRRSHLEERLLLLEHIAGAIKLKHIFK